MTILAMEDLTTPQSVDEVNLDWLAAVTRDYFTEEEKDPDKIQLKSFKAAKNEVQGILSETFVVDIVYRDEANEEEEDETLSIFVKVPLQGEPMYHSVNTRELTMFKDVLPKLQIFLDEHCEGFFRLPMPRLLHCHYDGTGKRDVFVMENLLANDYYNFTNEGCLNDEHMNSVIDCLSYLHGSGLAYKHHVGGKDDLQKAFPKLEMQIQMHDLLNDTSMALHFRKHFRAYLSFMEDCEPGLGRHTAYMQKMHKHILTVVGELMACGYDRLVTFAHGDAKPNNFMFRKIEIDMEELSCEGIEPILIDWQGGFLGSCANDLMWALFPFCEQDKTGERYKKALEYYHEQLRNTLESFNLTYTDLALPEGFPRFASLLKKCLVMEFLMVTVIKPIITLDSESAEKLLKWHKETQKNKRRRFKKKVDKPTMGEIFSSPRFTGFCHLYFHIATALGAFQEMGSMYFQTMKDSMFEVEKLDDYDSDSEDDTDLFSRVINAPSRTLCRAAAGVALLATTVVALYAAWLNRVWLGEHAGNMYQLGERYVRMGVKAVRKMIKY